MGGELDSAVGRSVLEHFADLDDPRVARAQRHSLLAVIAIALCGVICGAESWVEIAEFGRTKAAWLATFLDLPHGIPSHDTIGRVFAALDSDHFAACFAAWMAALAAVLPTDAALLPAADRGAGAGAARRVIALDGKTVRRSHDRWAGKAARHLVSAWASASQLVLAQTAVDDKSNEITAVPRLLRQLDVAGSLVTVDAMGCQAAIATQIVEQGADYVLALKENQASLYEDVVDTFVQADTTAFGDYVPAVWTYDRQSAKDHGRLEVREAWVLSDPAVLAYLQQGRTERVGQPWPHLAAIGRVVAQRRVPALDPAQQLGTWVVSSQEARYYLLSTPLAAPAFAAAVRTHWGIENRVHWLLDVAFREDDSRVRVGHAADNFALLRRLALNLLKHETSATCGIQGRRLKAGWSTDYLLKVLSLAP
jgi:predicted transposase YbfD/YdcC